MVVFAVVERTLIRELEAIAKLAEMHIRYHSADVISHLLYLSFEISTVTYMGENRVISAGYKYFPALEFPLISEFEVLIIADCDVVDNPKILGFRVLAFQLLAFQFP